MCFSAAASFTAGIGLCGAGAVAVWMVPTRRELPLAAMPLIFGLQQIVEGALWLALADGDTAAQYCLTTGFLAFAEVFWPLFVPLAVWLIEPPGRRRTTIVACMAAGVLVTLALLHGLVTQPRAAELFEGHIYYHFPHYGGMGSINLFVPTMLLYLSATCLSLMLASDRTVRAIGVVMALAFIVTSMFYETWMISVWCFFGALLSGLVLLWAAQRGGAAATLTPPARTS